MLLAPTRALLGVRFIVLPPRAASAEPALRAVYDGADARIFEDPTALPRAFVVSRARCADDREALALLRARAIGADEVVLADCAAPAAGETNPIASRGVAPDSRSVVAPGPRSAVAPQVRMLIDEPARVVVAVSTATPAWLVLTDTWFPGWRARIDGRDVVVRRADHAFRAVALPPGPHEVEFTFTPRGLVSGAAVTLGALLIVGALLIARRRDADHGRRGRAGRDRRHAARAGRRAVGRVHRVAVHRAGGLPRSRGRVGAAAGAVSGATRWR